MLQIQVFEFAPAASSLLTICQSDQDQLNRFLRTVNTTSISVTPVFHGDSQITTVLVTIIYDMPEEIGEPTDRFSSTGKSLQTQQSAADFMRY